MLEGKSRRRRLAAQAVSLIASGAFPLEEFDPRVDCQGAATDLNMVLPAARVVDRCSAVRSASETEGRIRDAG